jgi:gas vesicle protein
MCDSHHKTATALSFSLGTLVGAGAGLLLSTHKGKKLVKRVWQQIEPYISYAVESAKDEYQDLKQRAEDTFDQTVDQVKDFAAARSSTNTKKPTKKALFKGV